MVETSEQVRPLAPATSLPTSSDDEVTATTTTKTRRTRFIRCGICVGATLLILAIVLVILIFTVFRVRDPTIEMNGVTFQGFNLLGGTTVAPRPGTNLTVNADVSVKNPNYASFRFPNTTTTLYYRGVVVGEVRGPPGKARARRTLRMSLVVEVLVDQILLQPGLGSDINSGLVTINSFTRVGGRVRILVVNRHVNVRMNCTIVVNISSQAIQQQRCTRRVNL